MWARRFFLLPNYEVNFECWTFHCRYLYTCIDSIKFHFNMVCHTNLLQALFCWWNIENFMLYTIGPIQILLFIFLFPMDNFQLILSTSKENVRMAWLSGGNNIMFMLRVQFLWFLVHFLKGKDVIVCILSVCLSPVVQYFFEHFLVEILRIECRSVATIFLNFVVICKILICGF